VLPVCARSGIVQLAAARKIWARSDPAGLDRAELIRLDKLRVPVSHFDKSKRWKAGYLVCVEEHNVKLPCECAHR
jgi:NAD-specific glutamate dehydrogenase